MNEIAESRTAQAVRVVIASYLEPQHVDRIRSVDPRLEVVYEPHLLPPPRYAADHIGEPFERPEEDERRWVSLLAEAEVLFDFDRTHLQDLPELAPSLTWIQATSAGIGQLVARLGYAERMPETVFSTASGVHAIPLAEYALMSILIAASSGVPANAICSLLTVPEHVIFPVFPAFCVGVDALTVTGSQ